jgi:hypothetical protein
MCTPNVVAEKNGQMNANRRWMRSWEKFKLIKHKDGTISLRSAHGKYVVAERNGKLNVNRRWMRSWEKFKLIYINKARRSVSVRHKRRRVRRSKRVNRVRTVALKTTHGKYLVAEKNGQMNANRRWLRAWEKFKMIRHKDGTISLKSAHGKYVASGAHL